MYRQATYIVLTFALAIFFISCGGDGGGGLPTDPTDPPDEEPPEIASVAPDSGKFGTAVTITGKNFAGDPDANKVTFNGTEALVSSASDTQLVTEVPEGAETGPVEIAVEGETAEGPEFKYIPTITVTTYAGSGQPGYQDGDGSTARFNQPIGIDLDADGNIYVGDGENNVIREITSQQVVSTYAGTGDPGYDDGSASVTEFDGPTGLAFDGTGSIILSDQANDVIRDLAPNGDVTTFVGDTVGNGSLKDGFRDEARFESPTGLDIADDGTIYVADRDNSSIRKITPDGQVTTVAGIDSEGFQDGSLDNARFNFPLDLAVGPEGNLWISDSGNNAIRKIDLAAGQVSTVVRSEDAGFTDGPLAEAKMNAPAGIDVAQDGTIYFCDLNNHSV